MEPDRLPEWVAHPSDRDEEELARLLAQDPARAEEFWRQTGMDALLAARQGKVPAREDLWDRVWAEVEREQGSSANRRRSWRARRRAGPGTGPGLRWLWIAAAALFGVIVIASLPSREPGRTAARTPAPPVPEPAPPERPIEAAPRKAPLKAERPQPAPPEPEKPAPPAPEPPKPAPVEPKVEPKRTVEPPPPPEKPAPGRSVVVAVAGTIGRIEGEVACTGPDGRRPARSGEPLPAGHGLESGAGKSAAGFAYADSTRLEIGPSTALREIADAPATGKRLSLDRGTLSAEVVRQDRPMVVTTPHAEARVLGTTFQLTVDPAAGSTRLDVTKGRVRLTRLSDGRFTDVGPGQFAVAAAGPAPAAKAIPARTNLLLAETFEDARGVDERWIRADGVAAVKSAGRLEIDLSPRASETGWRGGGLVTRQAFAPPLAVSADVEIPTLHAGIVTAIVFLPPGQARGGDGVLRIQLREKRYAVYSEKGEPRELAGADRRGGGAVRERWRVEIEANRVRLLVDGREVLRHAHDLPVAEGYRIEMDGAARQDAPAGARAAFDNVTVELLRP